MAKKNTQTPAEGGALTGPASDKSTQTLPVTATERKSLPTLRKDIRKHHRAFIRSAKNAILQATEAGMNLLEAKRRITHGHWRDWLRDNFSADTGLSERTAQRYMDIARNYGDRVPLLGDIQQDPDARASPLLDLSLTQTLNAIKQQKTANSTPEDRPPTVRGNDWLTPPAIIEAVTSLLGTIDLDPAAEAAASNIPATKHCTANDDSLRNDIVWQGTVFLNPGCEGDLLPWVTKALEAFQSGSVSRAVLVLPAAGHPSWPSSLRNFPAAFAREHFQVRLPESDQVAVLKRSLMFVYLSNDDDVSQFAECFSSFADVYVPFISMEKNQ